MSENNKFDFAIIGGGIVGAATFYKMQSAFPEKNIILIEKEDILADDAVFSAAEILENKLFKEQEALEKYKELLIGYPASLYGHET